MVIVTMMNKPQLFLDLDGVMADFETHFRDEFGVETHEVDDKKMWGMINSIPDYFLSMPMMEGATKFFKEIEKYNPIILTACPRSNYQAAAIQKRQWVRNNLSEDIMILPVMGGKNKAMFINQVGDILIDDFVENCDSWNLHGGFAIHHKNFNDTMLYLNTVINLKCEI